MKFEIGPGATCDLGILLETRLLVQSQSGGGKTTLLRRVLEKTHGSIQQIVIDPEGELYTLREQFDYIIAGKGGDCAADPRSAKLLAVRLLELGVSAICDLSELRAHDRIRFVRLFLEALVEAPRKLRHPVLVVIDEAHLFAPEKGQAESTPAVIDLCARGRKRGLCALLATQRLSKLHKDTAAELRNVLIGATGLDIDQRRAGDVLGFEKADRLALRDLKWREFYAYGPALSPGVKLLTVGDTATANPKIGLEMTAPAAPTEKIRALLSKVADLPAEAEEKRQTEESLRRDLAETRRKLTIAERAQPGPAAPSEEMISKRVVAALAVRDREHVAALREAGGYTDRLERAIKTTADSLSATAERLRAAVNGKEPHDQTGRRPGRDEVRGARIGAGDQASRSRSPLQEYRNAAPPPRRSEGSAGARVEADHGALDGPETRILNAIAWFEALGIETPEQPAVAFLAGYTYGGGGFNNPRGRLNTKGLIEYVPGGMLRLTEAGRALAITPETPATNAAMHEAVMAVLPIPHQRILRPLLDAWPDAMTNEANAEASGYTPGTGGHNNPRGRLKKMGLIEYPSPGMLRARDLLFPEEPV